MGLASRSTDGALGRRGHARFEWRGRGSFSPPQVGPGRRRSRPMTGPGPVRGWGRDGPGGKRGHRRSHRTRHDLTVGANPERTGGHEAEDRQLPGQLTRHEANGDADLRPQLVVGVDLDPRGLSFRARVVALDCAHEAPDHRPGGSLHGLPSGNIGRLNHAVHAAHQDRPASPARAGRNTLRWAALAHLSADLTIPPAGVTRPAEIVSTETVIPLTLTSLRPPMIPTRLAAQPSGMFACSPTATEDSRDPEPDPVGAAHTIAAIREYCWLRRAFISSWVIRQRAGQPGHTARRHDVPPRRCNHSAMCRVSAAQPPRRRP